MAMSQASRRRSVGAAARILGDVRRGIRLGKLVDELSRRPSGKVSEVYRASGALQAAYDFLEHETVRAEAVQRVASAEAAMLCRGEESVYLVLDGSSLNLTDTARRKGFGSIGPRVKGAQGLKVLNGLALTASGETIGVLSQQYWARGPKTKKGYRPLAGRESHRWHEAFDTARASLHEHAPETRLHVLADREADASLLMRHLLRSDSDFTIRANGNRKVKAGGRYVSVRSHLKKQTVLARHSVTIPRSGSRRARAVTLAIRAVEVTLVLRDHHIDEPFERTVTVIWAHEEDARGGAKALDWMLYTTVPARKAAQAVHAVVRYTYRWRIEDFHKQLKSGGGNVEDSQLRSQAAVIKWATLHAMIAARAQRLRDASRTTPDVPATSELSEAEIEALVIIKTMEKRRTETISAEGLKLAQAVRWIGDIGGFAVTGVSKKMPGTTIIGRGLERLVETTHLLHGLKALGKMR